MYFMGPDRVLRRATPVRCKDEGKELQDLLQENPALLAGEQIEPDQPRRWLLIKREMEVPDPTTGAARWSIDFLFVDQDATLTFVECKRHNDTRSRREVISQVMDYAANASRLWTMEQLLAAASGQALADNTTVDAGVARLGGSYSDANSLMQAAADKLARNDIRIILFMEEAPPELKTIVEFMNKEMSTVELLLVEARMYDVNGMTVVAPRLWGFTEQVRQQKLAIADAIGNRRQWDEPKFFAALDQQVCDESQRDAVRKIYGGLPAYGYAFKWGTGSSSGSFNVRSPASGDLALITVRTDGTLTAQFGNFAAPERAPLREALAGTIRKAGLPVPDDYAKRYVNYRISDWAQNVDNLLSGLSDLAKIQT